MPQKVRRAAANEMKVYNKKLPLITLKKTKTDFPNQIHLQQWAHCQRPKAG